MTNPIKKIKRVIFNKYDDLTELITTASAGDLLLPRSRDIEHNQFLVASRLLDVKAFYNDGNESFYYQNAISRATYGEKHDSKLGDERFKSLLNSYQDAFLHRLNIS